MTKHFLEALAAGFVVTQIAGVATTIYLHRCATHMALTLQPAVEWLFKLVVWLTTGQRTKEWVAVHRKHHAFTDEEGDPHSPLLEGFWKVQLGNVYYYVRETRLLKESGEFERYSQGIVEGWWDTKVFNHGLLGLGLGVLILCATLGIGWGLVAAGTHVVLYVFVLTPSINGLCHRFGYKNFDNTATNLRLLALLTTGEGLHNNHHGHSRSPKLSCKPSEFDPAWPIIRLLIALHLAKAYKTIDEMAAV